MADSQGGVTTVIAPATTETDNSKSVSMDTTEKATLRKRVRSVGDDGPASPEETKQLIEARKKARGADKKSGNNKSQARKKQPDKALDERCVFCAKTGSTNNMIVCQDCEDYYHLACCGVSAQKMDTAKSVIALLG